MDIKNIIFDLGGVILNIDYHLTINAFEKLGYRDFTQAYSQKEQSELFDLLETGLITPNEFRKKIRIYIANEVTDPEIDSAWNALLLDFPTNRMELLVKITKNYNCYLLSNTNQIHYLEYCKQLKSKFGINNLGHYLIKEYYSHEINLRKPHASIFEFVLNDAQLNAFETLFIDDSIQHIKGAKTVGLHAIYLTNGKKISNIFDKQGILNNRSSLFYI